MYDYEREEREFSWTNLFIKVIIALIIILFIIWVISLINRKSSKTTDVVMDSVFSENISNMKDVGKKYFTSEKLPEKDGDVYTITLEDLYSKKLLPTLKDKNGDSCSAKKSYVSVKKVSDEYEMKVYLECGETSDYLLLAMICNDYCSNNMCDKEHDGSEDIDLDNTEYQYSKTVGGTYSNWGDYSSWSTNSVKKNDTTDVDTKVVKENYTYDKTITENKFVGNASCASISGYTLVSNSNGICSYSKIEVTSINPSCPNVSGYSLVNRTGFTCSYSGTSSSTKDPECPSVSGYTFTGRNGFTCNYSKTTNSTKNPECPSVSGYTFTGRNGFTCNYSKSTTSSTDYILVYYSTGSGSYVPKDTTTYHYVQKSADYVYNCDGSCGAKWYYTYTIYKKDYKTISITTTKNASCPSGYKASGNTCVKSTTTNTTKNATCPSGYKASGNKCIYTSNSNITKEAICPNDYYKSGSVCAKNKVNKATKPATCSSSQVLENGKCYQKVNKVVQETGTKDVTYYRYRTRSIIGGTIDYKWSVLKEDKELLNNGYKLTGKTRNIGGK